MKITIIGSGAMGGSYGAFLSLAGHDVALVDTWPEHVEAIEKDGLLVEGARGEHRVPMPIATDPEAGRADLAIVFVDSNNTRDAADAATRALTPDGAAITFQNGIGNVEKLQEVLGPDRVLGGSSMCSAASVGPGHVAFTHQGATSIGETHGADSERVRAIANALESAGFATTIETDILAKIWTKFVLNVAVNAICATTGLRLGEVARLPELDAFQDRIIDEALAVTEAKGIRLADPDIRTAIKNQCRYKFSRPSMLQHVEAGKRTEIDAINGALVREARALGLAAPCNEALTALLKGRELKRIREVHEPDLDYDAWELKVQAAEQ